MASRAENSRDRRLAISAVILIAVGFAVRLTIALQPVERLLPVCLADDAFYYLRIAENILGGRGPTFDGVVATNGYHPLWMLVSIGAVKLAGGAVPGASVLTVLLAAIGALNAALIWRLALRTTGPLGGLWAAGFWSLSPLVIFVELMGVEAPLMIAFVLATLLAYQPLRGADAGPRQWAPVGVWLGLALLARTDAILFAFPLALDVAAANLAPVRRDPPRLRARFSAAGTAACLALAIVAPWIIYNLARFGTVTQDSFRALVYSQQHHVDDGGASLVRVVAGDLRKGFFDYFLRFVGLPDPAAALAFVVGLTAGAVGVRLATGRGVFERRERGAIPALLWGATVWFFYLFWFLAQKMWYFLPTQAVLGLGGALLVGYFDRTLVHRRAAAALALTLAAALVGGFVATGAALWRGGLHPWQKTYPEAAAALRKMAAAEPGLIAAGFNSGIVSAFSGLPVINLDGVVNPEAALAQRQTRLLDYLRRRRVNVVVDHLEIIKEYEMFAGPGWRESFALAQTFPTPPGAGDVVILRVRTGPPF